MQVHCVIHLHQTTFENIVAIGEINYIQCSLLFLGFSKHVDNEDFTFKSVLAETHTLKLKSRIGTLTL